MSRNERFVSAARRLLAMQIVACVGAAAVAAWAVYEVTDLARERDALAARVAQLEAVIPPRSLPPPIASSDVPASAADLREQATAAAGAGSGEPAAASEKADGAPPDDRVNGGGAGVPTDNIAAGTGGEAGTNGSAGDVTTNAATPADPPVERNCRGINRRPITCVPPFTRTPIAGVCLDGRSRPMRCPPNMPRETEQQDQQQQPTRRR